MEKKRKKSVKPTLKLSKPKRIPILKKVSKNTETPITGFDSQSLVMRKIQRYKRPASKKKVSTASNTKRNYTSLNNKSQGVHLSAPSNLSILWSDMVKVDLDANQEMETAINLRRIPTLDIKPESRTKHFLKPGAILSRILFTSELLFVTYVAILIPLKFSFYLYDEIDEAVYFFDQITKAFLFLQLCLRFVTPIYINYELQCSIRVIASLQPRSLTFYLDMFSCIPWTEFLFGLCKIDKNLGWSTVIYASFLACLYKMTYQIKDFRKEHPENYIWCLLKLSPDRRTKDVYTPALLTLILVFHLYACLFYYIGINYMNQNRWLIIINKEDLPIFDQYVACVYFAVQTTTTTGYGDSYVTSTSEMILRSIYILTGVIVYSLCTGEVIDHLTKLIAWKEKTGRKMWSLKEIQNIYQIDHLVLWNIEADILDQKKLDSLKTNQSGDLVVNGAVKRELDFRNLTKEEIDLFYYSLFMEKFKGLKMFKTMDSEFILDLGMSLQKKEFVADQVIYSKNEPAANLFLISEGKAGFMLNRFEEVPFIRVEDGYFGEYELLFNVNRIFTVTALTNMTVYCLSTENFKKIFQTERNGDLSNRLQFKASDRQNYFNMIHNKFDTHIKNQLSKKRAFTDIQHLLVNAFKHAAKRRSPSKQKTKLQLFNLLQPPSKTNDLLVQTSQTRKSVQFSPDKLTIFTQLARNHRAVSSEKVAEKFKNKEFSLKVIPEELGKESSNKKVEVSKLSSRHRGSIAQPIIGMNNKVQVREVKMHVKVHEPLPSIESIKTDGNMDSQDDEDHYGSVRFENYKKIEKKSETETKNKPNRLTLPLRQSIRKELDPTNASNFNPLYLAFSNLYKSKRTKQ